MTDLFELLGRDGDTFRIGLRAESAVYAAHFPGRPVTPGACLVELCCQLAERVAGRALVLEVAPNAKFLRPVTPDLGAIEVTLTSQAADGGLKVAAVIAHGGAPLARLSFVLRPASDVCAVIPTYNNAATVADVVRRTLAQVRDVIVVNDGSTDATLAALAALGIRPDAADAPLGAPSATLVSYAANRGKGGALRAGLERAATLGFRYALTLDADGQHYPEDIPALLEAHAGRPDALVVGSRGLVHDNMPRRSTFANRFSNFWFALQTWQPLPDTQTGFRLYPLDGGLLRSLRWLTARYEAELELLVLAAWRGTRLVPVSIRVYYPPAAERVSHFRPLRDFARISVLNTVLCLLMLVYGWPRVIWFRLTKPKV